MFHPHYKASLTFIGVPAKIVPFPQFELQTKLVARILSGKAKMPSDDEMQEWMHNHYDYFKQAGLAGRHMHKLGQYQWEYNDWLAEQCGPDVAPTPPWRLRLYNAGHDLRQKYSPDAYRDHWDNEQSLLDAHDAFRQQGLVAAPA